MINQDILKRVHEQVEYCLSHSEDDQEELKRKLEELMLLWFVKGAEHTIQ